MFWTSKTIRQADLDRLIRLVEWERRGIRWTWFAERLAQQLSRAKVKRHPRCDVVTMYSTVALLDLAISTPERLTLVFPHQASVLDGRLSILTTLGIALLGARQGDVLRIPTGEGLRTFKIQSVEQPPARCRPAAGKVMGGEGLEPATPSV